VRVDVRSQNDSEGSGPKDLDRSSVRRRDTTTRRASIKAVRGSSIPWLAHAGLESRDRPT
jgi:hypothetical protein